MAMMTWTWLLGLAAKLLGIPRRHTTAEHLHRAFAADGKGLMRVLSLLSGCF
jgi:hypothetical protein